MLSLEVTFTLSLTDLHEYLPGPAIPDNAQLKAPGPGQRPPEINYPTPAPQHRLHSFDYLTNTYAAAQAHCLHDPRPKAARGRQS